MEEENTYLVEGEFAFKSYLPDKLKPGMHFLTVISIGILEPEYLFFTLEEVPEDEDMYMSLYGAPIHLFVITSDGEEEILANPKEIGWFNNGEEVIPITDQLITDIINEHDGFLDVECDETGDIILLDGKVIISYLVEEEEEEEDE